MLTCPLCLSAVAKDTPYHQDKTRDYFQCTTCSLVFVAPSALPSASQERAEYALHQNHDNDPGYRRFLRKMADPIVAKVLPGQCGLDFGCGPAPVLARMLQEAGLDMSVYDPYFFPDKQSLSQQYDVITCTEAIEHFHQPATELTTLTEILRPGGWLGIMTKRVINQQRFATWHYKNDPTHVCFFSEATFHFIGKKFGLTVSFHGPDTVLMQKNT